MSEKQLREGAVTKALDQTSYVCVHCLAWSNDPDWLEHEDDCPMRADPDLVGLLQELHRGHTRLDEDGQLEVLIGWDVLVSFIEVTFGLRLTDEPLGWEWTEEG